MSQVDENSSMNASKLNASMNMSIDLDESGEELEALITKAKTYKMEKKTHEKSVGVDVARRLLERQRDALRVENKQLETQLQETADSLAREKEHKCAPPPSSMIPVLLSLLLGIAFGYTVCKQTQQ